MVERINPDLLQQGDVTDQIDEVYLNTVFPGYRFAIAQAFVDWGIEIDDSVPLYVPPKPHEYELDDGTVVISGARYLIDGAEVGDNVLYVAFMEPGKKTTEHLHNGFEEIYVSIAGELNVAMDGQEHPVNGQFTVPPGTKHHGVTYDSHSLTLLIMKGARGVPQEQRHSHS